MVKPKPFLKWAGGKGKLISQLRSYLPDPGAIARYYEPFLGGGAVFFELQPDKARLSDLNPELINVYICVRDHVERLIELLGEHKSKSSPEYYEEQRLLLKHGGVVERGARFIYLNKTGFNGLYRENSKGEFNVPYGDYRNPPVCDPEGLRAASRALQNAEIVVDDFGTIQALPGDFVYFDPPYEPVSATSNFTGYTGEGFSRFEQVRLRNLCKELSERSVPWLLSNSDCPFVHSLYQGFQIEYVMAARSINSEGDRRGKIKEVVILDYQRSEKLWAKQNAGSC